MNLSNNNSNISTDIQNIFNEYFMRDMSIEVITELKNKTNLVIESYNFDFETSNKLKTQVTKEIENEIMRVCPEGFNLFKEIVRL